MAPYTNKTPRRSFRIQNLPAVNYADTRSYSRAAVAKKAPVKKAAAKKEVLTKKAPIRKAPAKKAPAKKAPAKKAPVKKSTSKKVKQESSSSSSGGSFESKESGSNVISAAPAKKAAGKKNPPKNVKQESSEYDSDEWLDDEDSNSGRKAAAAVKKGSAKKSSFKVVKKKHPSPPYFENENGERWWDYSNVEPWHSPKALWWYLAGTMEMVSTKFNRRPPSGDPRLEVLELQTLIQALIQQLEGAKDTLAEIRDDPDGNHPTVATLYFSVATDPQGPRAALEDALTEHGLVDRVFFISQEGLRHMYLAWRDCVETGEITDDRQLEIVHDAFCARTGLPYLDSDFDEERYLNNEDTDEEDFDDEDLDEEEE